MLPGRKVKRKKKSCEQKHLMNIKEKSISIFENIQQFTGAEHRERAARSRSHGRVPDPCVFSLAKTVRN